MEYIIVDHEFDAFIQFVLTGGVDQFADLLESRTAAALGKRFAFVIKVVVAVMHLEGKEIQDLRRNRTEIRIQTQIIQTVSGFEKLAGEFILFGPLDR